MTTIDGRDTLPPTSAVEVYLSPDELQIGALYEVESGNLEPIAYCIDREHFYGLRIEINGDAFYIKIGTEEHHDFRDKNGISSSCLPIREVLPSENRAIEKHELAILLVEQNLLYYAYMHANPHNSPRTPDVVEFKWKILTQVMGAWKNGSLQPPDEHGFVDIAPLSN
jgi:hypothetical protein